MPTVICNTSPVQYLYQADLLFLLPSLFGGICIPEGVVEEILRGRQENVPLPDVHTFPWIQVCQARQCALLPTVSRLGKGEKEVLALGVETPDSLLLLDDRLARRHSDLLSLPYIGTLGILLLGKEHHLIESVAPIVDRLNALGFRIHPATREHVLRLAGEGS